MRNELGVLRGAVAAADLPLDVPGAEAGRSLRKQVLDQLDDYVLPRYERLDAPLLAVVGGSTGAGKSTLVNAIVGERVTRPGALRPTTRDPVLIHHPGDGVWFTDQRVLPGLPRTSGSDRPGADGGAALHLVATDRVPAGLAILDAPDVDSVVEGNRALAGQLLAAADLWVFVTTAARYADAVPWDLLREAARRDVVVTIVLDRVPPEVLTEIGTDLHAMLAAEGLGGAPLFVLAEQPLTPDGALPQAAVADLRAWLWGLAADGAARAQVVRRTLTGAVRRLAEQSDELGTALDGQAAAADDLRARIEAAYSTADVEKGLADGSVLRGEVLSRWQDFIGTGELFRGIEAGIGRVRDRIGAFLRGKPQPEREVEAALGDNLHTLLVAEADAAAERAQESLRRDPLGRAVLAHAPQGAELTRAGAGFSDRTAAAIRGWQQFVLDLVRVEGQGKRTGARVLALGVNAVAVVLMMLAFASTGGLMGAEIAIAGGSAVLSQRLLEAVFGENAVRRLAATARADLDGRIEDLFAAERSRYAALVPETTGGDRVRAAAALVRATPPAVGA